MHCLRFLDHPVDLQEYVSRVKVGKDLKLNIMVVLKKDAIVPIYSRSRSLHAAIRSRFFTSVLVVSWTYTAEIENAAY